MTRWASLPIRGRLTVAFAASMAVVIGGLGVFVFLRTGSALLDTLVDHGYDWGDEIQGGIRLLLRFADRCDEKRWNAAFARWKKTGVLDRPLPGGPWPAGAAPATAAGAPG